MLCWGRAQALLANIKTKGWFVFHRNFTLAKLCSLQWSYSSLLTNVSTASGQEPSGRTRKPITKQKDKQEAHGEDNPQERDKNKHVALGRKQLAKINCIVSLSVLFVLLWNRICFCYRGMGYISAEESELDRLYGRSTFYEAIWMKMEWIWFTRWAQLFNEWKPSEKSRRRKGRKWLEESWAGPEHVGAKTQIWIKAAEEQRWAPKVRPETKGMNNPRRPKKGHNGGKMLLLSEEKRGGG